MTKSHTLLMVIVSLILMVTSPSLVIEGEVGYIYREVITTTSDSLKVDVTWYTSSVEECDDTPFITADGTFVKDGIVALSRDLFEHFGYGDSLYIDEYGWLEVRDCMNTRWKKRIDIWCDNKNTAIRNGFSRGVISWNYRNKVDYIEEKI